METVSDAAIEAYILEKKSQWISQLLAWFDKVPTVEKPGEWKREESLQTALYGETFDVFYKATHAYPKWVFYYGNGNHFSIGDHDKGQLKRLVKFIMFRVDLTNEFTPICTERRMLLVSEKAHATLWLQRYEPKLPILDIPEAAPRNLVAAYTCHGLEPKDFPRFIKKEANHASYEVAVVALCSINDTLAPPATC
jgi:hypothetical protein